MKTGADIAIEVEEYVREPQTGKIPLQETTIYITIDDHLVFEGQLIGYEQKDAHDLTKRIIDAIICNHFTNSFGE